MKVKKKSEVFNTYKPWSLLPVWMLAGGLFIFLIFRMGGAVVWALIGIAWVGISLVLAPVYLFIWLRDRWLRKGRLPGGFGRLVLLHYLLLIGFIWMGNRFQNREYVTIENRSGEIVEEIRFSCNGAETELHQLAPGRSKTLHLQPGYHDNLLLKVEARSNWRVRSLLLKEQGEGRIWPCTIAIHPGFRLSDNRVTEEQGQMRRLGNPEAPLVVLLQGYDYLPERWDALIPALLSEGYQILEIRPPGTTAASPPAPLDRLAPAQQADWIHELLLEGKFQPRILLADQTAEPVLQRLQQSCPAFWPDILVLKTTENWPTQHFPNSGLLPKLWAWWHGPTGLGNRSQASYLYLFSASTHAAWSQGRAAFPLLSTEAILQKVKTEKDQN